MDFGFNSYDELEPIDLYSKDLFKKVVVEQKVVQNNCKNCGAPLSKHTSDILSSLKGTRFFNQRLGYCLTFTIESNALAQNIFCCICISVTDVTAT